MKKQLIMALAVSALSLSSLNTMAEGGYIGAQYAKTTYEQSNTGVNPNASDGEAEPGAIILIAGYKFSENIALEGRYGFDGGSDDFTFTTGGSTEVETSSIISVLGKFSLGGSVSPYALVGFTDYELDAQNGQTVEGDSGSLGVGIDISVSENAAISLEYIQYVDADISGGGDAELSAVSIGVNINF